MDRQDVAKTLALRLASFEYHVAAPWASMSIMERTTASNLVVTHGLADGARDADDHFSPAADARGWYFVRFVEPAVMHLHLSGLAAEAEWLRAYWLNPLRPSDPREARWVAACAEGARLTQERDALNRQMMPIRFRLAAAADRR